jgi:hypothetical protein
MCFVPPGIITGIPPFMVGFTALPLVALAGGFLILARLERNWYLAAFSIVLLAIPGISEHIFTQNLQWEWIGATGFSMIVAGALLLGAAVIAWNGTRRAA